MDGIVHLYALMISVPALIKGRASSPGEIQLILGKAKPPPDFKKLHDYYCKEQS